MGAASCARVKKILEIPKGGSFREPIPGAVAVAWKPGGIEGVQTAWGLVDVPGAPYAIAVMVNYGPDDMDATVREISAITYRYFAQVARTSPHGTRVPLGVIKKDWARDSGLGARDSGLGGSGQVGGRSRWAATLSLFAS